MKKLDDFENQVRRLVLRALKRRALTQVAKIAHINPSALWKWATDENRSMRHRNLVRVRDAVEIVLRDTN